jgi:phosphomannomutase
MRMTRELGIGAASCAEHWLPFLPPQDRCASFDGDADRIVYFYADQCVCGYSDIPIFYSFFLYLARWTQQRKQKTAHTQIHTVVCEAGEID